MITMPVLLFVAEKIGRHWLSLGVKLQVQGEILENIEATCPNLPNRAMAVLYDWYQRHREYATKDALVMALRNCFCNDIADKISMME